MPLTEEEKEKIRYHMGYPSQGEYRSYFAGIPFNPQTLYLLEGRMERLAEQSLPRVRVLLGRLDGIDEQTYCASFKHMAAEQLEDLRPNPQYNEELRREYTYWQQRLAQVLNVPVNADFSGIRRVDQGARNVRWG